VYLSNGEVNWYVVYGNRSLIGVVVSLDVLTGGCVEIGMGVPHRIANPHDDELVIIEVQRGDYLGEDDIIRLEDDYGR
jgi:mannose-6-phosphate isomerase-like protein (cupin superfamily)